MGQVARFQLRDDGTGLYKMKCVARPNDMYYYNNATCDQYRLKVVLWVKKLETGIPHHGG
jgi:hypothetical protein